MCYKISIDPATSSGVAIFKDNKPIEYYIIKLTKDYRTQMFAVVNNLIDKYNPELVCFEDYKVGKFANAAEKSYSIRCIIALCCDLRNIKCECINVSNWKRSLLGKYSSKKAKEQYGKDYQKILVKNKLEELGYKIPEKVTNLLNDKKYKTTYDVYDALAIGLHS